MSNRLRDPAHRVIEHTYPRFAAGAVPQKRFNRASRRIVAKSERSAEARARRRHQDFLFKRAMTSLSDKDSDDSVPTPVV